MVGTEGHFGTLPDGLQIYLEGNPNILVIGIGLGFNEVPDPLVESFASGNKTYLVINSTRLLIKDPSESGLKLIADYPKATGPRGTKEKLLFFEVVGINNSDK